MLSTPTYFVGVHERHAQEEATEFWDWKNTELVSWLNHMHRCVCAHVSERERPDMLRKKSYQFKGPMKSSIAICISIINVCVCLQEQLNNSFISSLSAIYQIMVTYHKMIPRLHWYKTVYMIIVRTLKSRALDIKFVPMQQLCVLSSCYTVFRSCSPELHGWVANKSPFFFNSSEKLEQLYHSFLLSDFSLPTPRSKASLISHS